MEFQTENHEATQNDRTDYTVPSFSFRLTISWLAVKFNGKGTQTLTERQVDWKQKPDLMKLISNTIWILNNFPAVIHECGKCNLDKCCHDPDGWMMPTIWEVESNKFVIVKANVSTNKQTLDIERHLTLSLYIYPGYHQRICNKVYQSKHKLKGGKGFPNYCILSNIPSSTAN